MFRQTDAVSDSAAVISGSAVKESNVVSNTAIAVSGGAVKKRKSNSVIMIWEQRVCVFSKNTLIE